MKTKPTLAAIRSLRIVIASQAGDVQDRCTLGAFIDANRAELPRLIALFTRNVFYSITRQGVYSLNLGAGGIFRLTADTGAKGGIYVFNVPNTLNRIRSPHCTTKGEAIAWAAKQLQTSERLASLCYAGRG